MRREKKDERERIERKQKETDRGVTVFSWLAHFFTSAYVYQCDHLVRAHPASSAAINMPFQHSYISE